MAASCREFTGLARPATTMLQPGRSRNELCFLPLERKELGRRKKPAGRGVTVVAAVSEELPRLASAAGNGAAAGRPPPPGKVAVRAALTVRRKHKEDLKEAVAGHLDALWDMVGRGVVLELISTKIHPSKQRPSLSFFLLPFIPWTYWC
jgi:lipoxygenase